MALKCLLDIAHAMTNTKLYRDLQKVSQQIQARRRLRLTGQYLITYSEEMASTNLVLWQPSQGRSN